MSSIKFWPTNERPREKLLNRGAQALSDAELLAIFLRTGIPGKNAIELARDIISHFKSLQRIFSASEKEFCQIKGLGRAKFVQLQASLEMTRRYLQENLNNNSVIESPNQVKEYLSSQLKGQKNEVFAALFLDNQHKVLGYEELFYGTVNAATVHPRVVVQKSLAYNAAALIVAHNHPSGVTEPSLSDIDITNQLKSALELIDVRLLDHLIVAVNRVTSFAELGKI